MGYEEALNNQATMAMIAAMVIFLLYSQISDYLAANRVAYKPSRGQEGSDRHNDGGDVY